MATGALMNRFFAGLAASLVLSRVKVAGRANDFAQFLHGIRGDFNFAQNLHKMLACTEFAHYFLPQFAHRIAIYIDTIGFCLLLCEQ